MSRKSHKKSQKKTVKKSARNAFNGFKTWAKRNKKKLLSILTGLIIFILIVDTITIVFLLRKANDNKQEKQLEQSEIVQIDETGEESNKEETVEESTESQPEPEVKEVVVREVVVREVPQQSESPSESSSTSDGDEAVESYRYTKSNNTDRAFSDDEVAEGVNVCARDDNTGRSKENMTLENVWTVDLMKIEEFYYYKISFRSPNTYGYCIYSLEKKRAKFVGINPKNDEILKTIKEL